MRVNGIRAKASRKFKVTTNSKHTRNNIPDLVKRNFHAEELNTLWTSDITHIYTREGWLYLCVILDVSSWMIIGWSMLNRITEDLVMSALIQAVRQRRPKPGLIFHSDRGSQYDSLDVKRYLNRHFFRQSMSRKGSCYDNAITESFFHSLKTELVHSEKYETRMEAMISLFDYIEIFYNRKRRHSALGYKTPEEFELMKRKIYLN